MDERNFQLTYIDLTICLALVEREHKKCKPHSEKEAAFKGTRDRLSMTIFGATKPYPEFTFEL